MHRVAWDVTRTTLHWIWPNSTGPAKSRPPAELELEIATPSFYPT
ncbi:MAG TPA: hypothetical protein VH619_19205 [Verrucomicrobiae bacterium]|nr:hypothetical protein [Verrucomicrobiae bacterium]